MKISVVISTILIAQVSASFLSMFQDAVLSVQNSVGKLITDVAHDVRDTVDCTLLAVEHVLSWSEDATDRYYDKCGNGKNKTDSEINSRRDVVVPKVEVSLEISSNDEDLRKEIPAAIDARINETLKKVLGSYDAHENIVSVQKVLANESKQLADVSSLVKQELEKLTNEVNSDFKNMKQNVSVPSVDSILQEIRLLENREKSTKNNSEADEIHRVIDKVLNKLDIIEATEATENLKLEQILKNLENNSVNSSVSLREKFGKWKEEESRHLDQIKNKIEEHEGNNKHSWKYNNTQPVDLINKTDTDDTKSSELNRISLVYDETVQQPSRHNDSNRIPFSEISNNVKDKEILVSSTTFIANKNEESSTLPTNELNVSSVLNLNDQPITTKNPIPIPLTKYTSKSEGIHTSESNTDTEKEELPTLTTNKPTASPNTLNDSDLNDTLITKTDESQLPLNTQTSLQDDKLSDALIANTTFTLVGNNLLSFIDNSTEQKFSGETSTLTDETLATVPTILHNNDYNYIANTSTPIIVSTTINERSTVENITVIGNNDDSNDITITSTFPINIAINDTTQSIKPTTVSGIEELTTAAKYKPTTTANTKLNDDDSNNTMIISTSSPIKANITVIERTQSIETTTVSANEEPLTWTSTHNIISDDGPYDTKAMSMSPHPIKSSSTISWSTPPIEIRTVSAIEESSTMFTNKSTPTQNISNDYSNDTMTTSTSFPITVKIAVMESAKSIEITTGSEEPSTLTTNKPPTIAIENVPIDTITMTTSYPIKSSNTISGASQHVETTSIYGNQEPSTFTINKFLTTPHIVIDLDANDTMIMTTLSPNTVINTVIENTQPIEITTVSGNDETLMCTTLTTEVTTTCPNTVNYDNSNDTFTANISIPIIANATDSKTDKQKQVTIRHENIEPIDNIANGNFITGESFPTTESTLVSDIIVTVNSATINGTEVVSNSNKLNEDYLSNIVTTTTFPVVESATVASKDQVSPILKSSQSTRTSEVPLIPLLEPETNDTMIAGTISSSTDNTLVNKSDPSVNPSSLEKVEDSTLTTQPTIASPRVLNDSLSTIMSNVVTESSHDSEHIVLVNRPTTPSGRAVPTLITTTTKNIIYDQGLKSSRFTITESPIGNGNIPLLTIPEERKWLTPSRHQNTPNTFNTFNHQYYNRNAVPRNENYAIRDQPSAPRTEIPFITKDVYDENHTNPMHEKPSELYNQQPSLNQEQPKYSDVDDSVDFIKKRILETGTPYAITRSAFDVATQPVHDLDSLVNRILHNEPMFDMAKSTVAPTTPDIRDKYTPRRPIYPENLNFMESPRNLIRPPFSYNPPLANTNGIPIGLTTHKPVTTALVVNNDKNAPIDYDSFFHIPPKNSETHQRALREARQLIENSRRSEQIINKILKNRNSNGRRSIFNNPRLLNTVIIYNLSQNSTISGDQKVDLLMTP